MWYRWHADRRKRKHKRRLWGCEVTCLLVYLTVKVCLPPNVFIVFSHRRLSDVICADRQKETCLHIDICAYHIARRASAYKRFFYVFVYNHRLHWKGGSCLVNSSTLQLNNQLVYSSTRLLVYYTKKESRNISVTGPWIEKKAASYSPALHCSTIGVGGLNFSVRNGKRWSPATITTWYGVPHILLRTLNDAGRNAQMTFLRHKPELQHTQLTDYNDKVFGQLVRLGFDVTVFTPASYQRRSLQRPSMEF